MNIGGFMKQTFVDFPGHLSAIVFTNGCNLNCWYCHNKQLINSQQPKINENEILEYLKIRQGLLEGLVISGGEPTLQKDLENFILKVRNLGYKIKLDTNGTNPKILQNLIDKKLLDYVAMDIKTALGSYSKTTCANVDMQENIRKSIEILKQSNVEFEFRTTFAPDVTLDDIREVAILAQGCKNFYLQKYNAINAKTLLIPHNLSTFNQALEILKEKIPNAKLRGM